ncbi:MAG: serine/threonine-protein kinase [Planctomycetota bacterium]|nr:serine/threonine-protein kinase [Planctomycetota bacterium]MDA1212862.1 serine/threonine-protein kinase [Planctomycetota bacterium]
MASESNIPEKKKSPAGSGKSLSSEFKKNRLGKYEIKKKIGAGGMGAVYLAVDVELNRTVALKILPREKAQNPTLVKRFKAEGQAAALLRHENIVTVYEAGEADGYLYLALEYVEGTDVHNLVAKRGVLPVKRSIEIIRQLTWALQHSYEQNIVHRDLKPSNFLIKRDGTVKLTDMGLARSIDETAETGITRAGTTVGTVDYMSPEQARDSKAADVRSDIYSLGCSWYQMLTGEAPFSEGSLTNKLAAHATKSPPDPREKNEAVPEGVVAVIRKMMAKNPKDRYQTPAELLVDLDNNALTRGSISNDVLAALAGAEGEAEPVKKWASPSPSVELPPKMEAVPLLSEEKQIDISTIKIAGGVLLVAAVVGLFWWAAQSFSSNDGTVPISRHSIFQQGNEEGEGNSSNSAGNPNGEKNATPNGVSPTSPFGPPPGTDPSVPSPVIGGVSPNSTQVFGMGNTSLLATQAVGGIISRADEIEHLPDWSQNVEVLTQAGIVTAGSPVTPSSLSAPGASAPRPKADVTIEPRSPPRYDFSPTSPSSPGVINSSQTPGNDSEPGKLPSHIAGSDSSLYAALMQLPPEGGTIELTGSGPYFLPAIDLQGRQRIVLRAAEGFAPILVFRPEIDPEDTKASLIRISDSAVSLVGLNFVLVCDQVPPNESLTMIEVQSGDLTVHDCSFTLYGSRPGSVSAIRLTGEGKWKGRVPDNQSRILFNRVYIRGNGLTGLAIDQPSSDIIVSNSLFVTGSAPVFSFHQSSPAGDQSTISSQNCRVLSSTLVAESIWDIAEGTADQIPGMLINTVNSLIACSGENTDRPMFRAKGRFNASSGDNAAVSGPTRWLDWKTKASVFCGWRELVRIESDAGKPIVHLNNKQDWQNFWKQSLAVNPFHTERWPTRPIDDLARATPFEFDAGTLPFDATKITESGLPGCFIEQLPLPLSSQFDRAFAWSKKPVIPSDFFDATSGDILTVDINEVDLGLWLANQDLSQGATIIAKGSGRCPCSPIEIANTAVSIQFRAKDDGPPILVPQMPKVPQGLSIVNPTMILVSNGKLELRDAVIVVDEQIDKRKDSLPEWLLRIEQGSFSLQHSFLYVPSSVSNRFKGLIYWSGLKNDRSQVTPQSAGVISDSFLYGPDRIIFGELFGQVLQGRNSVFCSMGSLAEFKLPDGPSPNYVDLERCTFSPSLSLFTISQTGATPVSTARLSFFSEASLFAAPKDYRKGDDSRQVILTMAPNVSRDQLDWWEFSNAYAESIKYFHSISDSPSGKPQDFSNDWEQFWGSSRVQRPLVDANAVALRGHIKSGSAGDWTIDDFNLDRQSKAAKWSETGNPIGAEIIDTSEESPVGDSGKRKKTGGTSAEKSPQKVKPNF